MVDFDSLLSQFPIESVVASRSFEKFHLDVGIGDVCIEPLEQIQGKGWLDFYGIPAPSYFLISSEQQFAEKIHAYTLPREQGYNSRVKDLIDIALLINLNKINKERLSLALKLTFGRRKTHLLPSELPLPPKEWKRAFETLASQCSLKISLEDAFHLAANFYQICIEIGP